MIAADITITNLSSCQFSPGSFTLKTIKTCATPRCRRSVTCDGRVMLTRNAVPAHMIPNPIHTAHPHPCETSITLYRNIIATNHTHMGLYTCSQPKRWHRPHMSLYVHPPLSPPLRSCGQRLGRSMMLMLVEVGRGGGGDGGGSQ